MKVYIQSKSGNYNTTRDFPGQESLLQVLSAIRYQGGFYIAEWGRSDKKVVYVPFEEIEHVRESDE